MLHDSVDVWSHYTRSRFIPYQQWNSCFMSFHFVSYTIKLCSSLNFKFHLNQLNILFWSPSHSCYMLSTILWWIHERYLKRRISNEIDWRSFEAMKMNNRIVFSFYRQCRFIIFYQTTDCEILSRIPKYFNELLSFSIRINKQLNKRKTKTKKIFK